MRLRVSSVSQLIALPVAVGLCKLSVSRSMRVTNPHRGVPRSYNHADGRGDRTRQSPRQRRLR